MQPIEEDDEVEEVEDEKGLNIVGEGKIRKCRRHNQQGMHYDTTGRWEMWIVRRVVHKQP